MAPAGKELTPCSVLLDGLDLFAQFGSYHLICSNKQLITGSMEFPDNSTAGGNKKTLACCLVRLQWDNL